MIILLAIYDFTNANQLFAHLLLTAGAFEPTSNAPQSSNAETPFSDFLSLISYMVHHAHRSSRTTIYSLLSLLTVRVLCESPQFCGLLCSNQKDRLISPRLCRQRAPFLPLLSKSKGRVPAEAVLDICMDGINHNLKLRLDVGLYAAMLHPIHRILSYIATTKTKSMGDFHWTLLWQCLISLIRFLTTYAGTMSQQNSMQTLKEMLEPLLASLALVVSRGEEFLSVSTAYDDLVYKLVEAGPTLFESLKSAFLPPTSASAPHTSKPTRALEVLLVLTRHYQSLLMTTTTTTTPINAPATASSSSSPAPPSAKSLSPREVLNVIRKGYETLKLPSAEGLERWDRWRESADSGNKALIKRIGRMVVEDGRKLAAGAARRRD